MTEHQCFKNLSDVKIIDVEELSKKELDKEFEKIMTPLAQNPFGRKPFKQIKEIFKKTIK